MLCVPGCFAWLTGVQKDACLGNTGASLCRGALVRGWRMISYGLQAFKGHSVCGVLWCGDWRPSRGVHKQYGCHRLGPCGSLKLRLNVNYAAGQHLPSQREF